jgi:hypothetical protein
VSLKRLAWTDDILARAEKSVKDEKPRMALTRIGMARRILRECRERAQKYAKRDAAIKAGKEKCFLCKTTKGEHT